MKANAKIGRRDSVTTFCYLTKMSPELFIMAFVKIVRAAVFQNTNCEYFLIFNFLVVLQYCCSEFFSIIILITQTYKTKNITITRYYFILPVPGKKEKNKLIPSEIEVYMITKET